MDNCQNCYEHIRYACGGKGNWARDHKNVCWKPDYPILERENAELKERNKTLERISRELDRQAEIAIERRWPIIDENDQLEQALERACEWFVENVDCRECPLACTHRCIGDPAGCKAALIRYFKEATQ